MKRVLIITDYYLPGFKGGGPIRTIANTIDWLGDEFEFYVLAGDRDFKDTEPYPDIQYGAWMPVSGASVRYLASEERRFGNLGQIIASIDYDLLYVNSFFAPMCAKTVLLHGLRRIPRDRPVLLNPRGEFNPGSIGHKRVKKRAYLALIHALRLTRGLYWQAATNAELANIGREFAGLRANPLRGFVVGNLPRRVLTPPPALPPGPDNGPLRVAYLSRISRTKQLHMALEVLAQVRCPVEFAIYGPLEDPTYWETCQAQIAALPPHIQAAYQGGVPADQVIDTLAPYHAFLLPTRGESYGHVIWEALYAGCLPVISDRTPWTDELHARGIGWAHPLDAPERFVASLETIAAMPESEYRRRALAAQACAKENASPDALLKANRSMFRRVLGLEPQQETA